MKTNSLVAVGMAWVMFAVPCLQVRAQAGTAGSGESSPRVYFDPTLNRTDASIVYAELSERQRRGSLSFKETLDLAMSLYLQQHWEQSAGVYQSAVAVAKTPGEKAAAILGAAQSLANAQRWHDAAILANVASRLLPNSKEAVAARYAFWKKAGDDLEAGIAEDRIKQLNLNADGKVVFEPLTMGIVAIVLVTGSVIVWIMETKPKSIDKEITALGTALAAIITATVALQYQPTSD